MKNIAGPQNREIIDYLRQTRSQQQDEARPNLEQDLALEFRGHIPLDELRTHPGLGERLYIISKDLEINAGYILGYNVLINAYGIIFVIDMGTGFLAFRLSPQDRELAAELGGATVFRSQRIPGQIVIG